MTTTHASVIKTAYWEARKGDFADAAMTLLPRNRLGDLVWSLVAHRRAFGRWPDHRRPKTANEHWLRMKLSGELDREIRIRISDKELVKDFVRERLGEGHTPRTLAVLRTRAEIERFDFPDACVVKPTHASGRYVLRGGASTPIDRQELMRWLDEDFYLVSRERNYRALEHKVIVEEIVTSNGAFPEDYKFFCFNGVPTVLSVNTSRGNGMRINYFSPNWRELLIERRDYPRAPMTIPEPTHLGRMLSMARELSAGFPFIRVDFYQTADRVLVGELTNLPDAAHLRFTSHALDLKFGALFEDPSIDVERWFGLAEDLVGLVDLVDHGEPAGRAVGAAPGVAHGARRGAARHPAAPPVAG